MKLRFYTFEQIKEQISELQQYENVNTKNLPNILKLVMNFLDMKLLYTITTNDGIVFVYEKN